MNALNGRFKWKNWPPQCLQYLDSKSRADNYIKRKLENTLTRKPSLPWSWTGNSLTLSDHAWMKVDIKTCTFTFL